jgi:hypothetical protein
MAGERWQGRDGRPVESWACPYMWHWIYRTQCLHGQFDVGVSRGTNWGRVKVLLKEGRKAMYYLYLTHSIDVFFSEML